MDRTELERIVESYIGSKHPDATSVWIEDSAGALTGANIDQIMVDETLFGYVLTSTNFREGYQSERTTPKPGSILNAIGDKPVYVFVQPDTQNQQSIAGMFRNVQDRDGGTEPDSSVILAGKDFHRASITRASPQSIVRLSREAGYMMVPEHTNSTPTENLLARAGIPVTYVMLGDPIREATFRRSSRGGLLHYTK
ncbi:MAG: hypothetical protein ACMXYM_05510 [Candidatus Woesearchaeota archaeon]